MKDTDGYVLDGEFSGTPPSGDGTEGGDFVSVFVVGTPLPLVADFTAQPTNGSEPLVVSFTDESSGTVTSWSWDFDDDGTPDSSEQNPLYTYYTPGTYTVTL